MKQDTTVVKQAVRAEQVFRQGRLHAIRKLTRRMGRVRLTGVGLVIIVTMLAVALFSEVIAPYDPVKQDLMGNLQGPSMQHLLGTDELGRDVLSRVMHASRYSLIVGIASILAASVVGICLGLVAGFRLGLTDTLLQMGFDAMLSFPPLVLAMGITAALKPSLTNVAIALAIVYMPRFARLARGSTLSTREMEFVVAARLIGAPDVRIMLRHVLPNIAAPLIVQVSLSVGFAILIEASLSFLGLGVQPPIPTWGNMLQAGYGYIQLIPLLSVAPGLAIFLTVLGFSFLGDGLREALDPRLRRLTDA